MKKKKSSLLLWLALAVFVITMVLYDIQIRAAYNSGEFRIPYSNYYKVPDPKTFHHIVLNGATVANLKISPGQPNILIEPNAVRYLKNRIQNDTLYLEVDFGDYYTGNWVDFVAVVTCPGLNSMSSNSNVLMNKKMSTDTLAAADFKSRQTLITGFTLDSLTILEDYASNIALANNRIQYLTAKVGLSPGSGSNLLIDSGNHFLSADLDIRNRSRLWINDSTSAPQIKYNIGEKAVLITSGQIQHQNISNH